MPASIKKQTPGHEYRKRQRSFLLRCWVEEGVSSEEEDLWHFSLIHLANKQKKTGFACLESVFEYLKVELAQESGR